MAFRTHGAGAGVAEDAALVVPANGRAGGGCGGWEALGFRRVVGMQGFSALGTAQCDLWGLWVQSCGAVRRYGELGRLGIEVGALNVELPFIELGAVDAAPKVEA